MRARARTQESSLELLLDTICNTFGGILFLAILVSLLLKSSGLQSPEQASTPPSEFELLEFEQRLQAANASLAALQLASLQQDRANRSLYDEVDPKLVAKLKEWNGRRDRAIANRAKLAAVIANKQGEIVRLREETTEFDKQLASAQAKVVALQTSLKTETGTRAHTADLPQVRETLKSEVALIVHYGRLYVLHEYDRLGRRQGLNSEDFVVVDEMGNSLRVTPKPYTGISLKGSSARDSVVRRLKQFSPASQYVAVVVWDDSFQEFQALKHVLIELGFNYRLMPLMEGDSIADHGGNGGDVQ